MNHLLAHFPNILANEQRDLTKKRRGEQKKNYSRCHARLYEKADPLKALGSVASFLRNSKFYLINDTLKCIGPFLHCLRRWTAYVKVEAWHLPGLCLPLHIKTPPTAISGAGPAK